MTSSHFNLRRGYLVLHTLVFGAIGLLILGGIINWGAVSGRSAARFSANEQSFAIAEAGVEYYRWHLAHAPTDFQDGTGAPGPYVHDYFNQDNQKIGAFTLTITPPPVGSTVVTVKSEGRVTVDSNARRTVEAVLAIPSIAKYAVAANAKMRFGAGTEVFGPIHSNDGIRFDGVTHNLVTSAKASYDDADHSGPDEYGVHTHIAPTDPLPPPPPSGPPARADIFQAGRVFPVPAVDWNGFTADLANIKAAAQADGRYFGSSGKSGYRLTFKVVGGVTLFDLVKVTSLAAVPSNCDSVGSQPGWGSWSVNNTGSAGSNTLNQPLPPNGLFFFEDHVWVEGTIDGARLTVAAGTFPDSATYSSSNKHITVNNNLRYTNSDGSDVIGLIAQGNLNVGMKSLTDLRIDAALIAKNGRVGRYYYETPGCAPYDHRDTITLYGMIGTKERYGFAYTDGTGYTNRIITYDARLLYGPPPSFPLTSDHYQVISWREL